MRDGGTNAYSFIACCRSNTNNIFRLYNLGFSSIDLVLIVLLFSSSACALISTIIYHLKLIRLKAYLLFYITKYIFNFKILGEMLFLSDATFTPDSLKSAIVYFVGDIVP
jgi:hypothetical protein